MDVLVQANGTTDYFQVYADHDYSTSVFNGAGEVYFQGELVGRT